MKVKQMDRPSGREREHSIPSHSARAPTCVGGSTSLILPKNKTVTLEELLHWAFAREKVHLARLPGLPYTPHSSGRDSTGAIGMGGGGGNNIGFEAPADAYVVMWAVDALGGIASVVREFALIGSPPPWTPDPVIRVHRGQTVRDPVRHRPSYCEFSYRGDLPEHLALRRDRYRRWAEALAKLHNSLSGSLQHHRLSAQVPPPEPWK
jgi:hypothetical protein